mgnify:CR=1 FL=1
MPGRHPDQHEWVEFSSAPPPPGLWGGQRVVEARCGRLPCPWERRTAAAGGHTYRRFGETAWRAPRALGGRAPACEGEAAEARARGDLAGGRG